MAEVRPEERDRHMIPDLIETADPPRPDIDPRVFLAALVGSLKAEPAGPRRDKAAAILDQAQHHLDELEAQIAEAFEVLTTPETTEASA